MIYLITGLPGNGKTLYALQWVKAKAEKEGRPVFYSGIKGLTLPWTEIDPLRWFDCPTNAIVVIDECQRYFGVRGRGTPVPAHAQQLETHRHLGIDLVMITQSPMLLDNHDRSLMATHFHVVRNFGLARATVHEFQACKDNVLKSRVGSIRHEWAYPKAAYAWYQSAEAHTHKTRIPMRLWIMVAAPLVAAACAWYVWDRWHSRIDGAPVGGEAAARGVALASPGARPVAGRDGPRSALEYANDFVPRVSGLAYTAPAYDDVTKPLDAPYPAACVAMGSRCSCYTQQGTKLDVTPEICAGVVAGGFFVAWQRPVERSERLASARDPVPVIPVLSPFGAAISLGGGPPSPLAPSVSAAPDAPGAIGARPRAGAGAS